MIEDELLPSERFKGEKKEFWRPAYHFTAPSGWLNDPNGLIYYKGWYHLFYQYNPAGCEWGPMHWGHAVSRDFLHWKDLPPALKPDQPYDDDPEGGCFSGSAVEKDGRLWLFYTGAVKRGDRAVQTQCMAYSDDGVIFHKYRLNPVIAEPPEGNSEDFRDPKVFFAEGGWNMVVGGSACGAGNGGDGRIYLYRSEDLLKWKFAGTVLASDGKLGTMFECPDMFGLDGKWIVTCSPMYHPGGNKALYCVGTMDFETCRYEVEKIGCLDYGSDYYAAQSCLDQFGKRIMTAWQNGWDWMPWCTGQGPSGKEGWRCVLALPRRITLDSEGSICAAPISLDTIQRDRTVAERCELTARKRYLYPGDPFCFEVSVRVSIKNIESQAIEIGLFDDGEHVLMIDADFVAGVVTIDKSRMGPWDVGRIHAPFDASRPVFEMRILVDHSSVEVITAEGRCCMTTNVYPDREQTGCFIRTPYKTAALERLEVISFHRIWD